MTVFWFRRDLRLDDNAGLFHALHDSDEVLPVFIFDKNILSELPCDDARVTFISELLQTINLKLITIKKSVAVFFGEPENVFRKLIAENHIKAVYANDDYEPYATRRDTAVEKILFQSDIAFKRFKDHVIFERNEIVKSDGNPYVVFTPYSKIWKDHFENTDLAPFGSEVLLNKLTMHDYQFLGLADIGFIKSKIPIPKADFSEKLISEYEKSRNYPGLAGTSKLGIHLRFGSVSIRKIAALAASAKELTFLNELIWREFFIQILWHFPSTLSRSFRPKYDALPWRNDESEFDRWCKGTTGYPIVDAGMRELNATGFMHNRVRMITAGFLCKHLLIDWRWGEAYFALKLLDFEQASNVGNWQWAAGSGVDAAPYFRIFNPMEQAKKFDKEMHYIKKWIPEIDTALYPNPMVDHKEARERCLKVYSQVVR